MAPKIPERYENYCNMGRPIPGTRFISFKVPLRSNLATAAFNRGPVLTPRDLMDHCSRLGLIIDLTNTRRYYNPSEFTEHNIEHVKIYMLGRQIPKNKVVKKFFKAVDKFMDENEGNDRLIGVHCTHGLNRTGYMICRYMIQTLKISPDQAIADFNSARGHEQEHHFYLEDLRKAEWINETYDDDEDEKTDGEVNTPSPSSHKRQRETSSSRYDEDENYNDENGWNNKYRRRSYSHSGPHNDSPDNNTDKNYNWTKVDPRRNPAKRFYDNYYGNNSNQYDPYYYQRQGCAVGPHRPPPRQYNSRNNGNKPRQYRGPRQYQSPEQDNENKYEINTDPSTPLRSYAKSSNAFNTPLPISPLTVEKDRYNSKSYNTPRTPAYVPGPKRNPFSPGASDDVFSPENSRHSKRYNPY